MARYSRHPISGIGRTSLRSVAASCSKCRTPEKAASALTTAPGAFVMNEPIMNITTINRVSCFHCLERIDEGDMVFGVSVIYSNLHTILNGSIYVGIMLNGC